MKIRTCKCCAYLWVDLCVIDCELASFVILSHDSFTVLFIFSPSGLQKILQIKELKKISFSISNITKRQEKYSMRPREAQRFNQSTISTTPSVVSVTPSTALKAQRWVWKVQKTESTWKRLDKMGYPSFLTGYGRKNPGYEYKYIWFFVTYTHDFL